MSGDKKTELCNLIIKEPHPKLGCGSKYKGVSEFN